MGRNKLAVAQSMTDKDFLDGSSLFTSDGNQGRGRKAIANAKGCAGSFEGRQPVSMSVEGAKILYLSLEMPTLRHISHASGLAEGDEERRD